MNDRILGYYLSEHPEQGLFPPNGYFNEPLIEYDEQENPIIAVDWLKELKKYFNDIVWEYYFDRRIFGDENKFPYDKPIICYNNLRKSISIIINTKAYTYGNLYNSTILEFNPLWNVDGTVETVRELKQTGTDNFAHTGSDTSTDSGSDITTDGRTTYDTNDFLNSERSTLQHGLSNTTQYGSQNRETRNLRDNESILVTRQGNIGVTKSTELLEDYRKLVMFDLLKYITHDIVNQITYGIY